MPIENITPADLEGLGLEEFDPAEYIASNEAAAAYLTEALASNNAAVFASAVGDVARARGMTEIAKLSGLARESLYKALRPNSQPRMETLTRVLAALDVRLVAEAIPKTPAMAKAAGKPAMAKTAAAKPLAKKAHVKAT